MILLAAYIASCIALGWVFVRLDVWARTRVMLSDMATTLAVIRNPAMNDLEKERALQTGSIRLLGRVAVLTLALVATFGAAAAPVALGVWAKAFGWTDFLWFTLHPAVLGGTIVVCWAWAKFVHRPSPDHGA